MSIKEEKVIVLPQEHMSVLKYMRYRKVLPNPPSVCRRKNASDSVSYRKKGNDLYKMKNHDEDLHEKIWKTYTQSIALAPNNSEELAYGYGNRSALLFHLKKFKECIKDCDRALAITQSKLFKIKLLTRKAECLFLLSQSVAEDVSNEALQLLGNVKLDDNIAKTYIDKLKDISSACNVMTRKEKSRQKKDRKKYYRELSNFPRSDEVACASKSVAIHYNKEWGRHVVATEDLKPGDIFTLEKNYYTYICTDGMYLFCSNCTQSVWSSIPCEHCIYDVYCSESCRSQAWNKFHQWECPVYPFIWDIDEDLNANQFALRMVLIAINEVGGIDKMKKLLMDLDKSTDPRTKGFTKGIFQTDSIRSVYSLTKHCIVNDPFSEFSLTEQACIGIELLARNTTFFGQKMDGSTSSIFENKDVVFLVALILHTRYITRNNAEYHCKQRKNGELIKLVTCVRAFSSLFNHSCDPNIQLAMCQNNITVGFAVQPIKKGTQLFNCYSGNFLEKSKDDRQTYLELAYKIKCQCLPCRENWSNICLPTVETLCEITPELNETWMEMLTKLSRLRKFIKSKNGFVYSPKVVQLVVFYLESLAKKFTVYTEDYEAHSELLEKLLYDVFKYFYIIVPDKCFSS